MVTMISLAAKPRDVSMNPKALRRAEVIPGVVYGHNYAPKAVQFDYFPLARTVLQAGTSHFVSLTIEGEPEAQRVLVREVQRHPVTSRIMHIDLMAVMAGERIRIEVPLVQRGEAPAIQLGGIVVQLLGALQVECLPDDMPAEFRLDLSRLTDLHSHLSVADLEIPENVTVLTPADTDLIQVSVPRAVAAEEAEVAPPVQAVEGEAAPAAPAEESGARAKPGPAAESGARAKPGPAA
jgi:large subunit ribosomal protein L25